MVRATVRLNRVALPTTVEGGQPRENSIRENRTLTLTEAAAAVAAAWAAAAAAVMPSSSGGRPEKASASSAEVMLEGPSGSS